MENLPDSSPVITGARRPSLTTNSLLESGFVRSGGWRLAADGTLERAQSIPAAPGVYAFSVGGTVVYVGLATMGLARRLYFYARPGRTQSTSIRIGQKITTVLRDGEAVEILTATPPDLQWNGLPVSALAGLEYGLIAGYALEWNIRGA